MRQLAARPSSTRWQRANRPGALRAARWLALALVTCGLSAATAQPAIRYSPPITITKGGVYRGNWQSLDYRVPAVTIKTSQPVIIEHSNIRGRGRLIYSAFHNADVVINNVRGEGLHPNAPPKALRSAGRFLHLEQFRRAVVINNELNGTSGMYFREFSGRAAAGDTIRITRNRARNIDGRISAGPGLYSKDRQELVQFVQFNKIKNIRNAEISWNEVINEPGKSRVEEVINMFLSSGVPSSNIKIHNNYIQGAYGLNPTQAKYNGAGINMGDGSSKTVAGASSYIHAYRNQLVGTNTGIAMAAGHHLLAYENRVISSGYLPDGRASRGQNVGIYIWDFYDNKQYGTFFNVVARNNLIGWSTPLRGRLATNPSWFPDCARLPDQTSRCTGNVALPGPVTQTMERLEYLRWQQKLAAAKIRVGVQPR